MGADSSDPVGAEAGSGDADRRQISLPAVGGGSDGELLGDLARPAAERGLVVFAHGSGSSRLSSRNRWVADSLVDAGFATLLMDLLTAEEESQDTATGHLRFDIELLTARVLGVLDWVLERAHGGPLALFGASTGAAAALGAAARRPSAVRAVVSRGGRPDLAAENLSAVRAPTLLVVGGRDTDVLALNRSAARRLRAEHRIEVVEGATHLFEEPGALEHVADCAGRWFDQHVPGPADRHTGA